MDAITLGMNFEQATGSIIARIVGESAQTAAPRLSSMVHEAKAFFARQGKEPGRFSVSDPLQLVIQTGEYKLVMDLNEEQEGQVNQFFTEHVGELVNIEFAGLLKQELDGADYTTKKGLLFGLVLGAKVATIKPMFLARDRFMRRRSLVALVVGQNEQSGMLAN